MWNKISNFILSKKVIILCVIAVVTVFMGMQLKNVRMKYSYTPLLNEGDSSFLQYEQFRKVFGEDAVMTVVGFEDDNFLTAKKCNGLKQLHKDLKKISGVESTLSYVLTVDLQKDTLNKKFVANKIFEEDCKSDEEVKQLFERVKAFGFYDGLLYTKNNSYILAINCNADVVNCKLRDKLIDEIEDCVKKYSQECDVKYHISGLPYTKTRMMFMVRDELVIFSVVAICIVAIIMCIFFRSLRITLFSVFIVMIGVVWALGAMTLFKYELTILSGMLPPLLIVIGVPNTIYLLNKYIHECTEHGDKLRALNQVISKVGKATFLTNLTTAAGFATFLVTGNNMLMEFGVVTTIGIIIMFTLTITMIPILLSYSPIITQSKEGSNKGKFILKVADKLADIVENKRSMVYSGTVILVVLACIGLSFIKNESYQVDDLPESNVVYQDLRYFEKEIGGILPYEICIDTKKAKGVMNLNVLKKIEQFQDSISFINCITKPQSIVDGLKIIKRAYYNNNQDFYELPSNMEMGFMQDYLKGNGDNPMAKQMLSTMIDSTYQKARISLKIGDIGTTRMLVVTDSIENILHHFFPQEKFETYVTGSSIIFTKGSLKLVDNLVQSLALAIVLISICMVALFANWKMVIMSIIPNFIPLIVTAGIMGYFGIRIKSSTILVFNIAFGISVDNAIHLLTKLRQELEDTGWDLKKSVILALKETSVSVIYSAFILLSGFLMYTFSQFGGTVALGLLISITLFVAMFTNLMFLPEMLLTFKMKFKKSGK